MTQPSGLPPIPTGQPCPEPPRHFWIPKPLTSWSVLWAFIMILECFMQLPWQLIQGFLYVSTLIGCGVAMIIVIIQGQKE